MSEDIITSPDTTNRSFARGSLLAPDISIYFTIMKTKECMNIYKKVKGVCHFTLMQFNPCEAANRKAVLRC
jgi:hypothetical protein